MDNLEERLATAQMFDSLYTTLDDVLAALYAIKGSGTVMLDGELHGVVIQFAMPARVDSKAYEALRNIWWKDIPAYAIYEAITEQNHDLARERYDSTDSKLLPQALHDYFKSLDTVARQLLESNIADLKKSTAAFVDKREELADAASDEQAALDKEQASHLAKIVELESQL